MRYLKQSTSVDVVIGPIWATADGAFKSDLAYNASGINCDIYKVGTKADITLANSAGDGYFRAGSGEAQYILTLSTGHTDTLGMARITLSATGYAMKPEDFMVVPANVWDSLFGSDKLDVNAAEVSGDSGAADALEDFFDDATSVTNFKAMYDGTGYAGGTIKTKVDLETIKTQAVTCGAGVTVLASVGTAATATAQTGDAYAIVSNGTYGLAAIKTLIDAFATDADIAQATWDALLTAITTDGSVGKLIKDYLDAAISSRGTADPGDAMTLADDSIKAATFDESTAFPLKSADADATAVARTGADSDTLETISDQMDLALAVLEILRILRANKSIENEAGTTVTYRNTGDTADAGTQTWDEANRTRGEYTPTA